MCTVEAPVVACRCDTGAVVDDRYGTLSLTELLMELSNSLMSTTATHTMHGRGDPTRMRRKRRRDALNALFEFVPTRATTSFSSSFAPLRQKTRQLLDNAKQNIELVSVTHATLLEILCGAVAPDILSDDTPQAVGDQMELSEVELMLYIILHTSMAAAPTWQKPPVIPRCWLSPSIMAMVEWSPALQRTMRWSCDPDPVVEAALGVDVTRYDRSLLETQLSCELPKLLTYYTDVAGAAMTAEPHGSNLLKLAAAYDAFSYWCPWESEEVRLLFSRKQLIGADGKDGTQASHCSAHEESSITHVSSLLGTEKTRPFFSVFTEEYPASGFFCSLLFVALHRGMVGQQDPYLLLRLEYEGEGSSSPDSFLSPTGWSFSPRHTDAFGCATSTLPIGIDVSPEFLVATRERQDKKQGKSRGGGQMKGTDKERVEKESSLCSRGVIAMLRWSCQSGTLFLRLHQLCCVSERPEWGVALGQYGKSAIEALRWILFSLQRLVAEMSDRAGGPHGVSFGEVLSAQQLLRCVEENIMALGDIFFVHAGANWEVAAALRELSSATLLTSLYKRHAQRTSNIHWRDRHLSANGAANVSFGKIDVVADLFRAVLVPLHRMIAAWLRTGELQDPFDEFFIVDSHGTTACGFLVDASAQRLPEFISLEAAEAILHAGASLRALRVAARHVKLCATREQKRQSSDTEDVDAAAAHQEQVDNAAEVHLLLRNFMESLLGRRSPSSFRPMPEVDLLSQEGALSSWQAFYGACNDVLLSAGGPAKDGLEDKGFIVPAQLVGILPVPAWEGDEATRENGVDRRNAEEGAFGGRTKSLATSVSRFSKTTTTWCDVVTREVMQSAQEASCQEEGAPKAKERAALGLEYERRVWRCKAQRQLHQWKAQRLSLKLERAAALSRTVDDLRELYANVFTKLDTGEQQEEKETCEEDGRQTPIGKFVKPLTSFPTLPPCPKKDPVAPRGRRTSLFSSAVFNDNEEASLPISAASSNRPTAQLSHRFGGSSHYRTRSMSFSLKSLRKGNNSGVEECHEEVKLSEMHVVADINDDVYLMERAGPHVTDTSAMDAAVAQFEANEKRVRDYDISSEAYQKTCRMTAMKTFCVAGDGGYDPQESGESISKLWWTDPTADDGTLRSYKSITTSCTGPLDTAFNSTEEQTENLLRCPFYYHSLGRCTASFLTRKALQVMFLDHYGPLYRLSRQLLDVCLMQSSSVADRLTGLWQRLTTAAMEENQFDVSIAITSLNKAFVEEWESCVLYGCDTLQVQLALTIPDDSEEQGDVYVVRSERGEEDDGAGGSRVSDTAFRRRTLWATSQQPVAEEAEEDAKQQRDGKNEREGANVTPLPENPFDFVLQLTIVHNTSNEWVWLLPRNAFAIYGDLFSTLLFWTSVMQLVKRVWCVGIKSGVGEVFFFCNFSRAVLNAVVQHMWFLVSGYAGEYRRTLCIESDVLHSYQQLDRLTTDHAAFLDDCRFAAMLTPEFARARQQMYGMVRLLEEVEQALLHAAKEDTTTEDIGSDAKNKTNEKRGEGEAELAGERPSGHGKVPPPLIGALQKLKRKPQRPLDKTQQTRVDLKKPRETKHRGLRNNVRRCLRSFAGLTEKFVEHLIAVRDKFVVGAEPDPRVQPEEEVGESTLPRNTLHSTAQASTLLSLIRTLEMTQTSIQGKLS